MTQLATVFDGLVPASANPGVDPGAAVDVWTPTESGVYSVTVQAPDEPTAPFVFNGAVQVDMNAGGIGLPGWFGGAGGTITDEFQQANDTGLVAQLVTFRGAPVRAVVRVGLVAALAGEPSAEGMVVGLDELKAALGIALSDTSEDANLVALEEKASAWLEQMLERSFHAPASRKEYIVGNGTRLLPLAGTVESEDAAAVVVRERSSSGAWTTYDTPTDIFEVRRGRRVTQLVRMDGFAWSRGLEFEVTYDDGYTIAPADIRALVIDAVNQQRNALIAINDEGTVKSETIGDYSYTLDLSVAAGALSAGFSNVSSDTLSRWRRMHV